MSTITKHIHLFGAAFLSMLSVWVSDLSAITIILPVSVYAVAEFRKQTGKIKPLLFSMGFFFDGWYRNDCCVYHLGQTGCGENPGIRWRQLLCGNMRIACKVWSQHFFIFQIHCWRIFREHRALHNGLPDNSGDNFSKKIAVGCMEQTVALVLLAQCSSCFCSNHDFGLVAFQWCTAQVFCTGVHQHEHCTAYCS